MYGYIWKKCVRDYERVRDPQVRGRYTKLTAIAGIAVNTLLCAVKIILGIGIHSIAVIADGLHDLADSVAACITLISAKISRKPADKLHPYGHARIEYLASLLVSAIILVVGWELLCTSVSRCLHPTPTDFSWIMIGFLVFAVLLKGTQALFTIATGKRIKSLPVIAAGTDNRNDVITTIVVIAGMLIHHFTGAELDGYLGCIVSLFILYSGITMIRETMNPLLGEAPDPELVEEIRQTVLAHPEVLGVHDLIIYNYGPGRSFASFHAEVDSRKDLISIHECIDDIEHELGEKFSLIATCHMDPVELENPMRIRMQELIREGIREFGEIEDIHDLRIVPGKSRTRVIFDLVITPGRTYSKEAITEVMDRVVKQEGKDFEVIINFDQAYV